MPRRIGEEINELKIHDNISGSDIVLSYRNPTAKEQAAYTNESIQRKRNKVVYKQFEARQKFGLRILKGFREGDFEKKKDGKFVPFSSDPESPNYDPKWKDHLKEHASDLVTLLAAHVFDISAEIDDEDLPDEEEETVQEDAEKNLSEISGT